MLSELPNIILFLKPDSDGKLNELTNDQLRDEVTAWSVNKFSGASLDQFNTARERSKQTKDTVKIDPEFADYFDQFLSDTGTQRKYNKDVDQVFYRSSVLNSKFYRKNELDQEVTLTIGQLMSMWLVHVENSFTETETQDLLAAVNQNYQTQIAWTGDQLEMPVTPEFKSYWDEFIADSRLYELANDEILSDTPESPPPPPPPIGDIDPDAAPPVPSEAIDPAALPPVPDEIISPDSSTPAV
jgi:hypothetical protein